MIAGWDTAGDFSLVVDTLQEITLIKRGCDEAYSIAGAWRFSESTQLTWPENDAAVTAAVIWQLPIEADGVTPMPGDQLVEATGRCWKLQRVKTLRGGTRYRCEAYETVLRRDLSSLYTIERSIWADGPEGLELSGWERELSGILGVTDLLESTAGANAGENIDVYRLGFVEPVEVDLNHRFVSERGVIFKVVKPALLIAGSSLTVVEVEQVTTAD